MTTYEFIRHSILDDEPNSVDLLKEKLTRWLPSVKVLAACGDVDKAIMAIVQHKPDILFLDINMPGMNGLEFFGHVRGLNLPLQCIVVTAHAEPEYFKEALRLGLTDYLLKPVIKEELDGAISRVVDRIGTGAHRTHLTRLTGVLQARMITLPVVNGAISWVADVLYAVAKGKYSDLYFFNGSKEMITLGISELESIATDNGLYRIDRFMIVNLEHIQKVSVQLSKLYFRTQQGLIDVVISKIGSEKALTILKSMPA